MVMKGTSGAMDGARDHYGIKASHWTERVHSDRHVGELKCQEGIVVARALRRFGCWQEYVRSFVFVCHSIGNLMPRVRPVVFRCPTLLGWMRVVYKYMSAKGGVFIRITNLLLTGGREKLMLLYVAIPA